MTDDLRALTVALARHIDTATPAELEACLDILTAALTLRAGAYSGFCLAGFAGVRAALRRAQALPDP